MSVANAFAKTSKKKRYSALFPPDWSDSNDGGGGGGGDGGGNNGGGGGIITTGDSTKVTRSWRLSEIEDNENKYLLVQFYDSVKDKWQSVHAFDGIKST
jgi:hypothetical protein